MVGSNQDIPRTDSDDNSQPEWTGQANSASAAGASQKVSGANQNAPQSDQKSTMLELPKIIKVDPVKTEPSAERRSMDQKSTMLEMPAIKPNQLSPESPLTETQQDQKSTMLELPAVKAGYSTPTFEMPTAQTQQDQKSTMLELPVVGVKPDSDQRAAILEQSTMLELPAIKQDQRLAIPDAVAPQDQKSTMLELPAIKQDQRLAIRDAVAPQDQKSTMLELPAIKQDQRLAMSDAVAPQDQKSTMLELPKVRPGERPGASEQAAARQDQKSTMLEMPALKPDQRLSATEPTEPTQSTQPSTQINQQDQKSTMLERPPGSLQRTTNPEQKAIASDSRDPRDPRITNPNQPITNLNQAVQTDQRSTNQRTTNSNPSSNQRTINATPGLGNPNQRTTFNNQTTTGANQRTTNSNQRTTNEPGSLLNKTDSAARPKDSLAARVFARHTEAAEAVSIKKPLPEEVVETPAQESANPNSFANLADNVSVDTGGAWNEPIESVSSEFVRPAEEDAEAALWDKILETAAQAKAEAEAAAVAEAPEGAAPFWSRLVDPSNEAPGALEQKNSVEVLPDEEFDSSNNRPPASPKETLDEAIERERAAMRSNFPRTTGTTGTSRAASISQALERDKAWLDLKDKPDERVAIDSLLLESKPVDADEATLTHSEITKARTKAAKKLVAPKPTLMGNTMTFIAKHPIPFGVTAAVIVAVAGFFHWQSLQAANVQIEIGQKLLSSNP